MKELPKKIEPCPIVESVFEIRYQTDFPHDAVFGVLYSSLSRFFGNNKPISLPILQLPEAVRQQDPNLKYQAHHRLQKGNLILSIGPKVLVFSNTSPYLGWDKWSDFIRESMEPIEATKIVKFVDRIGLRYINIFDTIILDKLKLSFEINTVRLSSESTNFKTEIKDSGFTKVLQIGNNVQVVVNNEAKVGSAIDIDCLFNTKQDGNTFFKEYKDILEKAHIEEKQLFFDLLSDSFLESLNPIY